MDSQSLQKAVGMLKKFFLILNTDHFSAQQVQDAGLVSRAGSDFKDFVPWGNFQQRRLKGYREGLGNGLSFANGKCLVLIGMGDQSCVEKKVAG